jgi:hypothetical protein
MAAFVDAAHGLGMGVMMDVVLHHGAPSGNMLWDYDGWEEGHNGGIYHEGAPDCMWGRCAGACKKGYLLMHSFCSEPRCVLWGYLRDKEQHAVGLRPMGGGGQRGHLP